MTEQNCLNCYYRMGKTEDNTRIICEIDHKIKQVTYCNDYEFEEEDMK